TVVGAAADAVALGVAVFGLVAVLPLLFIAFLRGRGTTFLGDGRLQVIRGVWTGCSRRAPHLMRLHLLFHRTIFPQESLHALVLCGTGNHRLLAALLHGHVAAIRQLLVPGRVQQGAGAQPGPRLRPRCGPGAVPPAETVVLRPVRLLLSLRLRACRGMS